MSIAFRRHVILGALSLLLAGCSSVTQTVTLKGKVVPPSSPTPGIAIVNAPLAVFTLSGAYGKVVAATVQDAQGHFQFDLQTDRFSPGGELVKVAWRHPTKGGILLERTYRLVKNASGEISGNLSDISTLVTLAVEAQRQLDPSLIQAAPETYETLLQSLTASSKSLLTLFRQRYDAYLGSGSVAPGADADLAQSAGEMLFK